MGYLDTLSSDLVAANTTTDNDFTETEGRKADTAVNVVGTTASIMAYIKGLVAAAGSRLTKQTPSAAAAAWVKNTAYALVTATGVVRIKKVIAVCDIKATGATTTLTLRTNTVGTPALLAAVTATDLEIGDIWAGRETATHALEFGVDESESVVVKDCDIDLFLSNNTNLSTGQYTFYFDWEPVSAGATLVAATWA